MVTNGGYGGVHIALANGIPLVAAGTSEDKPEITNRIAWSGVGINLKTKTPTPEQVRAAVRTILSEARYRQRAQEFATEIARYDAPARAVSLLEELAATKQPVLAKAQGGQRQGFGSPATA